MKHANLIGALIVSLAAASTALAGPRDRDGDRGRDYQPERERVETRHHGFRDDTHARVVVRERHNGYYPPLGYYSHRWARGERLPARFYGRPYVIGDYRAYRLHAPPRGYHWVRVDGDAILAAVATGIVLDTVFDAFD